MVLMSFSPQLFWLKVLSFRASTDAVASKESTIAFSERISIFFLLPINRLWTTISCFANLLNINYSNSLRIYFSLISPNLLLCKLMDLWDTFKFRSFLTPQLLYMLGVWLARSLWLIVFSEESETVFSMPKMPIGIETSSEGNLVLHYSILRSSIESLAIISTILLDLFYLFQAV